MLLEIFNTARKQYEDKVSTSVPPVGQMFYYKGVEYQRILFEGKDTVIYRCKPNIVGYCDSEVIFVPVSDF